MLAIALPVLFVCITSKANDSFSEGSQNNVDLIDGKLIWADLYGERAVFADPDDGVVTLLDIDESKAQQTKIRISSQNINK